MNAFVEIAPTTQVVQDEVIKEIDQAGGALGRINGGLRGDDFTVQNVTRRLHRLFALNQCLNACTENDTVYFVTVAGMLVFLL